MCCVSSIRSNLCVLQNEHGWKITSIVKHILFSFDHALIIVTMVRILAGVIMDISALHFWPIWWRSCRLIKVFLTPQHTDKIFNNTIVLNYWINFLNLYSHQLSFHVLAMSSFLSFVKGLSLSISLIKYISLNMLHRIWVLQSVHIL